MPSAVACFVAHSQCRGVQKWQWVLQACARSLAQVFMSYESLRKELQYMERCCPYNASALSSEGREAHKVSFSMQHVLGCHMHA